MLITYDKFLFYDRAGYLWRVSYRPGALAWLLRWLKLMGRM